MLMMRPCLRAIIFGIAAQQQLKVPKTLVSSVAPPRCGVDCPDRADGRKGDGVVDEQAHGAEIVFDCGERLCDRVEVDNVERVSARAPASGRNLLRHGLDLGRGAREKGDFCALLGLQGRNRAADPATGAVDRGDFAVDLDVSASVRPPLWRGGREERRANPPAGGDGSPEAHQKSIRSLWPY